MLETQVGRVRPRYVPVDVLLSQGETVDEPSSSRGLRGWFQILRYWMAVKGGVTAILRESKLVFGVVGIKLQRLEGGIERKALGRFR